MQCGPEIVHENSITLYMGQTGLCIAYERVLLFTQKKFSLPSENTILLLRKLS